MKFPITEFYVYILHCSRNASLYTGYTQDFSVRFTQHNNGTGAKYTNSHKPCILAHLEVFHTRSEAMKREHAIKKLSRLKKFELVSTSSPPVFCIKCRRAFCVCSASKPQLGIRNNYNLSTPVESIILRSIKYVF
jgi:putative endonuclease